MKRKALKASSIAIAMLASMGLAAEEARKPGDIIWTLSVTTANPGKYVEPDAVESSTWTTETDCKQAEKLEQKLAKLMKSPVVTQCKKMQIVETSFYK